MMDRNSVRLSGIVKRQLHYAETKSGLRCCSFWLGVRRGGSESIAASIKINAYGEQVTLCTREVREGAELEVEGELMNRARPNRAPLIEVRATNIRRLTGEDEG